MKKFILPISIIVFISIIIFSACEKKAREHFRSYVTRYVVGEDGIELRLLGEDGIILVDYASNKKSCDFNSTSVSELEAYDRLCIQNNDMTFNKEMKYLVFPDWGQCYASNFSKVEVFSDANFDSEHSAGESLNDIVTVYYHSVKPFIDSNYHYDCEYLGNCIPDGIIYSKLASEISSTDLHLLVVAYGCIQLEFTKAPDEVKAHNITVKLHDTNGEIYTSSILFDKWD